MRHLASVIPASDIIEGHSNRRAFIAALVIAGHALLLLAIWSQSQIMIVTMPPAMALLDYTEPPAATASAPLPAVRIELPPIDIPLIEIAIPDAADDRAVPVPTSLPAAALGGCAPEDALRLALAASPEVMRALAAIPASQRSVADAIVVWNAAWSVPTRRSHAPLASIKIVVTHTLGALPAPCLAQEVNGPRLVLIEAASGPMVLAFGSGTWRWQDVVGQT